MKSLPLLLALCTIGSCATFTAAADASGVEALWNKNCASCHGPDGSGNTRMGKKAGAKDYRDPKIQAELKDETAIKNIKEGIKKDGKEVMKPYGDKLSDSEIKGLLAHMRSFKKT